MTPHLEVALQVGRTIVRDAIWSGGACNWLGAAVEIDHGQPVRVLRSLGAGVGGGTSGVALFLASLTRHTEDPAFAETARGALSAAMLLARSVPEAWSYYEGRIGVACTLIECGELLADGDLLLRGMDMIVTAGSPEGETRVNVLSGVAGCIAPLLRLWRRYSEPALRELAVACGRRLLATAERDHGHASWSEGRQIGRIGYARGAGGIGLALLQLAHATGDADVHRLALDAFRYEHDLFDHRIEQWHDPLHPGGRPSLAWCHGAAGIGLSRLAALRIEHSDEWLDDALRALVAVRTSVLTREHDFSLCHGITGLAEFFLTAAEVRDTRDRAFADWIAARGAELHHRDGRWPSGVAGGDDTPGLLLGRAGIGYHYLRMHAPNETPSILCITAAPSTGSGERDDPENDDRRDSDFGIAQSRNELIHLRAEPRMRRNAEHRAEEDDEADRHHEDHGERSRER